MGRLLIRISNHEVETLQKRLADIVERRQTAEMRVATIDAESETEALSAQGDVEAGRLGMIGFRQGNKIRRDQTLLEIDQILIEEAGPRRPGPGLREPQEIRARRRGRQGGQGQAGRRSWRPRPWTSWACAGRRSVGGKRLR